jgi:hypothetical protein
MERETNNLQGIIAERDRTIQGLQEFIDSKVEGTWENSKQIEV